nr:hypothetical protein Itr_chr11CG09590 [Ipomoea trifida]
MAWQNEETGGFRGMRQARERNLKHSFKAFRIICRFILLCRCLIALDFSSRSWIIANMKQRPSIVDPMAVWQAVVHADREINIFLHAGSLSLLNMQQRPLAGRSGGWMAIGGACKPRQQHSLAASSSTLRLAAE